MTEPTGVEARRRIERLLLSKTLRHAFHTVPGYQYLAEHIDHIHVASDLAVLPILEKASLLEAPELFRSSVLRSTFLQHTSGTAGRAIVLHRCQEEVDFRTHFRLALGSGGPQPIVISVGGDSGHGTPMPIGHSGPVFHLSPQDATWMDMAHEVVRVPWEFALCEPRDALIVGLEPALRFLTAVLVERGFDFSSSAVRCLCTTGDIVSAPRHAWFERTWGAPLVDRYSLSEVLGGAGPCIRCGWLHADPALVAEVVDPFDRTPITAGFGVLLVTSLFPFVQKQPLIRYWTGDVVEVGPPCAMGALSFRVEGRLSDCVLTPGTDEARLLLSPRRLLDVVEAQPWVALSKEPEPTRYLRDTSALGYPRMSVKSDVTEPRRIVVGIQPTWSPTLYPTHDRAVRSNLRDALMAALPSLRDEVAAGRWRLDIDTTLADNREWFRPGRVMDQ